MRSRRAVRPAAVLLALAAFASCDGGPTGPSTPPMDGDGSGSQLPLQAAEAGDLTLRNGSMEASEGWYFYAPGGKTAGYADGVGRAGSRGVTLTSTSGDDVFAFAAQTFNVEDLRGRRLTLRAHLRPVDVQGAGVAIAIRGDDPSLGGGVAEAFSTTQGRIDIRGTAGWTEYSVHLQDLDESIGRITVFVILLKGTTGSVHVDDVTLSSGEAVAVLPRLALENGGFEAGEHAPDSWWRGGTTLSGFTFAWSGAGAHEGRRAVSVTRQQASPEHFAYWGQTLRADAFRGGPLTLRARVRTELTGQGVSLVIRGDDTAVPAGAAEAFASTQYRIPITGSSGWVERSVTLDHLPQGMQSVTVYLVYLPGTTGSAHFDAVSLTR